MSTDHSYNGHTNYETWVVSLWLDNNEGDYLYWQERAQEIYDEAKDNPKRLYRFHNQTYFTAEEMAVIELTEQLKEWVEEQNPLSGGAGMFVDLLSGAISEVDFRSIAKSMIDEVEKDQSEDEADSS